MQDNELLGNDIPFNWQYHLKTITSVFKHLREKKNGGFCTLQRKGGG